jgi:hypothetical protein
VATAAYSFLKRIGVERIVFLGQDLSIEQSGKAYAHGSYHAKYALGRGKRFFNPLQLFLRLHVKDYIKEQDVKGRELYTRAGWLQFRDWFLWEFEKDRAQKRVLINASGQGLLYGKGIQQSDFKSEARILEQAQRLLHPEALSKKVCYPGHEARAFWWSKRAVFEEGLTRLKTLSQKGEAQTLQAEAYYDFLSWMEQSGLLDYLGKFLEQADALLKNPFDKSKQKAYTGFFQNLFLTLRYSLREMDNWRAGPRQSGA